MATKTPFYPTPTGKLTGNLVALNAPKPKTPTPYFVPSPTGLPTTPSQVSFLSGSRGSSPTPFYPTPTGAPITISAGGGGGVPSVPGASTSYAPQIPSTISSKSLSSSSYSSPSLPSYSSYAPSTISSTPGGSNPYTFNTSGSLTPQMASLGWKYENGAYVAPPEQAVAPADEKTGVSKFMQQFKDMINPKTSEADLYKQTYGVDINQAQADAARTRNELLSVTSQINDINATKNASLTSLLNVGAKEGVTTAVYGGQQAQLEREATIKLLPLQAQLATAQGAYEVAQGHLDNYFKAVTADNDANYKYQIDMFQWAYDRSDKADQAKITKKAQDLSDNKSYYTNLVSDIRTLAGDATNSGQGTLATNISKLITTLDPTSANFQSDYQNVLSKLASYQGQITGDPLERQKKTLEIQKLNKEIQGMGVPNITNPNAGQYSQALSVILGSGKFTKDQKTSVVNAINTGQDSFAVIKNQAKDIMGQTLATSLDKYETAKSGLQSVDSLLKQYYTNGGKTGIFTGNFEKTINKLGEVKDPTLVEIATNIAAQLQIYRNAVSGTAYSVQEGRDIASIFPGINKTEGLNNAILAGRMKAFDTTIDSQYRNTLGSTYDDLKKAQKVQTISDSSVADSNPFLQVLSGKSTSNIFDQSSGMFNIPTK